MDEYYKESSSDSKDEYYKKGGDYYSKGVTSTRMAALLASKDGAYRNGGCGHIMDGRCHGFNLGH